MQENRPAQTTTSPVDHQPVSLPSHTGFSSSQSNAAQVTDDDLALFERLVRDDTTGSELSDTDEDPFELLRDLLLDEYRQQIAHMRREVEQFQLLLDDLERQFNDDEALISTITPVIASAIRTNISESREEMVDALYPIMGRLVQRSVSEAMRDLAQRIDQQMRRTLDFKSLWRQLRARLLGISGAEMVMRDALPLQVDEIFLIHRETGLLLLRVSRTEAHANNNDVDDGEIISGMLTAITDFTQDAFGRGDDESLNEIQYGGRSILLEAAHLVYIAVVIAGFENSELRNQMREVMIAIEHRHASALRRYDGDASRFHESTQMLATLLASV